MRRHRPPPTPGHVRWVHGFAAPGAVATTFGRTVFVRAGHDPDDRLRRHEYEHVLQYHRHGRCGFLTRYLRDYLAGRLRGRGHRGAYRHIRFEVSAEWRARRALGLGVVAPADRRPVQS